MFKDYVRKKLETYVRAYLAKHKPRLILVVGSVGKTSTKMAIATVLAQKYRVRVQEGNHNTHLSVPTSILGIAYPKNIRSFWAWQKVFSAARKRIRSKTNDCDVIVQELGSDTPGDIAQFSQYLVADISIVTAVSPEHMENFKTLENVAKEELGVTDFSRLSGINRDDIPGEFAMLLTNPNIDTYGLGGAAEYRFEIEDESLAGATGSMIIPGLNQFSVTLKVSSEAGIKSAVAAAFVGSRLGMNTQELQAGLGQIVPQPGRMSILPGIKGTTLIDDTYNSSPLAVEAALNTLYRTAAPQRIAILGDMNELGEVSAKEHQKIGRLCRPSLLDLVVTIGPESAKYLAPAAQNMGCVVHSFQDPMSAGAHARALMHTGAIVLAKGSQNGVFAEEALKILLADSNDEYKLVRQTPEWMEKKRQQFDK